MALPLAEQNPQLEAAAAATNNAPIKIPEPQAAASAVAAVSCVCACASAAGEQQPAQQQSFDDRPSLVIPSPNPYVSADRTFSLAAYDEAVGTVLRKSATYKEATRPKWGLFGSTEEKIKLTLANARALAYPAIKTDKPRKVYIDDKNYFLVLPQKLKTDLSQQPGRVMIASDVHGMPETLDAIKQQLEADPNLRVILLGDYVDRGGDDLLVLQKLAQLLAKYPDRIFASRGNHDQYIVDEQFSVRHGHNRVIGDLATLFSGDTTVPNKVKVNISAAMSSVEIKTDISVPYSKCFDQFSLTEAQETTINFLRDMPLGFIVPYKQGEINKVIIGVHGFLIPLDFYGRNSSEQKNDQEVEQLLLHNLPNVMLDNIDAMMQTYVLSGDQNAIRLTSCYLDKSSGMPRSRILQSYIEALTKLNIISVHGHSHANGQIKAQTNEGTIGIPTMYLANSGGMGRDDAGKVLVFDCSGECREESLFETDPYVLRSRKALSHIRGLFERAMSGSNFIRENFNLQDLAIVEHVFREQYFAHLIAYALTSHNSDLKFCKDILEIYYQGRSNLSALHYFLQQVEELLIDAPCALISFREVFAEVNPRLGCTSSLELLKQCDREYISEVCLHQIISLILKGPSEENRKLLQAYKTSSCTIELAMKNDNEKLLQGYIKILNETEIVPNGLCVNTVSAINSSGLDADKRDELKLFAQYHFRKLVCYNAGSKQKDPCLLTPNGLTRDLAFVGKLRDVERDRVSIADSINTFVAALSTLAPETSTKDQKLKDLITEYNDRVSHSLNGQIRWFVQLYNHLVTQYGKQPKMFDLLQYARETVKLIESSGNSCKNEWLMNNPARTSELNGEKKALAEAVATANAADAATAVNYSRCVSHM